MSQPEDRRPSSSKELVDAALTNAVERAFPDLLKDPRAVAFVADMLNED
jgi:hypothetical protein